jgi:hypothetical protein
MKKGNRGGKTRNEKQKPKEGRKMKQRERRRGGGGTTTK